uniref:allophycocyanin beta 18 subunit n=1 Tax=Madagascaria erythrocladioides TaxID=753684 RepID=UPI001BF0A338|nr:allophycocyanin beta 18 subunit [Madagascaria erythrocladioides]QUE29105.1 ApcF [Madagascaria erythrocladioides]UNJ16661.1 allophycocyanin beta 18 subunit [Madagascaria erythrocladioides]|mmetsp:Transcript_38660/g.94687  ORF Transcript_38660/g.94687 Transcript_38660/m.94687 type:complete len:170 (+) Transcript_38660:102-611(+)
MQDVITNIVNSYDVRGSYLDEIAVDKLSTYFETGVLRVNLTKLINQKAAFIVKEASAQLYSEQPELLRPGGNSYTTRRYAACLRDLEYYLRYATYAIIAGDINILDERVLDGLKDTYNSLSVPIAPTVRGIQLLSQVIIEEADINSFEANEIISRPFNYMSRVLSEQNI